MKFFAEKVGAGVLGVLFLLSLYSLLAFWAVLLSIILGYVALYHLSFVSYPTFKHSQSVVFITGASSGIGKHSALELDSKGATVICAVRKKEDGEALIQERPSLKYVICDINKPDQIENAVEKVNKIIEEMSSSVTFHLVNNAGISVNAPLEVQNLEDIRKVYETNVLSQIKVTQLFLPLIKQTKGRIVSISSLSGHINIPFSGSYQMSKCALESFSDTLRRELAPWQIFVGTIQPGYVSTEIQKKGVAESQELFLRLEKSDAGRRYAPFYTPEKVAQREKSKKFISILEISEALNEMLYAEKPNVHAFRGNDAYKVILLSKLYGVVQDTACRTLLWPGSYNLNK